MKSASNTPDSDALLADATGSSGDHAEEVTQIPPVRRVFAAPEDDAAGWLTRGPTKRRRWRESKRA